VLASSGHSPYGIACGWCRDTLIAPNWSEYVDANHIRHSWSCETCGSEFQTSARPLAGWAATSAVCSACCAKLVSPA
jgi:hypothetical protein